MHTIKFSVNVEVGGVFVFCFEGLVGFFVGSLFCFTVFPFHLGRVAMVASWSEGMPIFGKLSMIKELG